MIFPAMHLHLVRRLELASFDDTGGYDQFSKLAYNPHEYNSHKYHNP